MYRYLCVARTPTLRQNCGTAWYNSASSLMPAPATLERRVCPRHDAGWGEGCQREELAAQNPATYFHAGLTKIFRPPIFLLALIPPCRLQHHHICIYLEIRLLTKPSLRPTLVLAICSLIWSAWPSFFPYTASVDRSLHHVHPKVGPKCFQGRN